MAGIVARRNGNFWGGRPRLSGPAKRTAEIKLRVRPDEYEALHQLAVAWDLPIGHVTWGLLSDLLSHLRGEARRGEVSVAIAAAKYLTHRGLADGEGAAPEA